jgi:general secretion pathway protein E
MGRVGLYELLPLGPKLRSRITADMDLAGFHRAARGEGLRTLRRAGLEKVAQGLTTIEEVLSVLPPSE